MDLWIECKGTGSSRKKIRGKKSKLHFWSGCSNFILSILSIIHVNFFWNAQKFWVFNSSWTRGRYILNLSKSRHFLGLAACKIECVFGHRSTSEEEILVSPAFSFLNKQVVLCSLFKLLSSKVYTPNTFHFFCHSDDEQRQNTPKKQQVTASQPNLYKFKGGDIFTSYVVLPI